MDRISFSLSTRSPNFLTLRIHPMGGLMSTAHTTPHDAASLEEKIRLRAYELYEQRAGSEGSAFDDWLRAEAEIKRQIAATATPSVRLVSTGKPPRPRKVTQA